MALVSHCKLNLDGKNRANTIQALVPQKSTLLVIIDHQKNKIWHRHCTEKCIIYHKNDLSACSQVYGVFYMLRDWHLLRSLETSFPSDNIGDPANFVSAWSLWISSICTHLKECLYLWFKGKVIMPWGVCHSLTDYSLSNKGKLLTLLCLPVFQICISGHWNHLVTWH